MLEITLVACCRVHCVNLCLVRPCFFLPKSTHAIAHEWHCLETCVQPNNLQGLTGDERKTPGSFFLLLLLWLVFFLSFFNMRSSSSRGGYHGPLIVLHRNHCCFWLQYALIPRVLPLQTLRIFTPLKPLYLLKNTRWSPYPWQCLQKVESIKSNPAIVPVAVGPI